MPKVQGAGGQPEQDPSQGRRLGERPLAWLTVIKYATWKEWKYAETQKIQRKDIQSFKSAS